MKQTPKHSPPSSGNTVSHSPWDGMARAVSRATLCLVNCPNFAGHGIPFGIIFGGTDLNEDVNQREKNEVMGKVLEEAR